MPDKTDTQREAHRERQRSYHKRMRENGMLRMSVWIPEVARGEFETEFNKLVQDWTRRKLMY